MTHHIKQFIKAVISLLCHCLYETSWQLRRRKQSGDCLNTMPRKEQVIVTLTTFPGRIHIVDKTIRTILNQKTVKPDAVELWLATEQFPNGEKDLPAALLQLKAFGLQICWCNDTRSYKKLIPALKKHPQAILVTADDDVYYRRNWLEKLYTPYLEDPTHVYCHRATMFLVKDGRFDAISGGRKYYDQPAYLNKLVGIGGVLYGPGMLHADVTSESLFMELAPTNDDIWFWFMAVLNDVRVCVVKNNQARPVSVVGAEHTDKLTTVNDNGEKKFWQQFEALLKKYPEAENKLRSEACEAGKECE